MLDLTDERWLELKGGYRLPYDPRSALASLETGRASDAWSELWQELHHQGDVDEASYAAVPHLVRIHEARQEADWNTYALVGTIEIERHRGRNPPLPDFLRDAYDRALERLAELASIDLARSRAPELVSSACGLLCLARGMTRAGRILLTFCEDELDEVLLAYDGPDPG